MISEVFEIYRETFRTLHARHDVPMPNSALELGALPTSACILTCPELHGVSKRVGVNLTQWGTVDGVSVVPGDARKLDYPDDSFDLVVTSSMLEHIPDFWLAISEMKRVLAPGGFLIINTPGFTETPLGNRARAWAFKIGLPDVLKRATLTMRIHDAPHDYYRFSEHCYRDVFMAGLDEVKIWSTMLPPRTFGMGRKPMAAAPTPAGKA
ncbi:MAG: class I SAM-dependent methyltransferase [Bradymonadaceae bacterium]|nr:class I SAM-dependent methyltransferase [Lujinxingiaceae bacterium]